MAFSQPAPQTTSLDLQKSDDNLTIYEGLSVSFKPAPLGKRVLAYIVDLAIVMVIMYIPIFVFIFVGALAMGWAASVESSIVKGVIIALFFTAAVLIFASIYHGYFIILEYRRGQTYGKKIFALKVVSLKGNRLTWGQCVLRDLIRYIDCSLIIPGLVSIIASQKGQRLGDFAAHTLVTHYSLSEQKRAAQYMKVDQYHLLSETTKPTSMPDKEMKKFLSFAFATFVIQTKNPGKKRLDNIAEHIKSTYMSNVPPDIDNKTIIRLYAEYCFRKTNNL